MAETETETKSTQFFIKLPNNKTLALHFPIHQTLTPNSIKLKIQSLTQIPIDSQTLTLNGKLLSNSFQFTPKSISFSTINLNFPLLGGKGGFGSLLRGAATKAGQKKTNNFDACRDMSGRRLRHVNAEKRIEEWKGEEEERRMEKVAEAYLRKMEKGKEGGRRDDGTEKYVEKYREDSRKCVEVVERSVRECFQGRKRKLKGVVDCGDAKKLKIWMGKRKVGESDSDDSDTESDDSDTEKEKSVVTENGNHSDSSKDTSCASVSVTLVNGESHSGPSSDSGSEDEKKVVIKGTSELATNPTVSQGQVNEEKIVIEQDHDDNQSRATIVSDQLPAVTLVEPDAPQLATDVPELNGALECKLVPSDDGVTGSSSSSEVLKPLNFDDFNSAAELEVLGMETLKSELQSRGLKCGGTLQERAARLFLLKTTPLDKLPKKLLAKK